MQANQTGVIWTTIIAGLILLIAMFAFTSSIKNANQVYIDDEFDQFRLENTERNANLDALILQVTEIITGFEAPEIDPSLCDNIDGCGGYWDVPDNWRLDFAVQATNELTEHDNRDLYRAIRDLVDVDDEDDILNVNIHRVGDVEVTEDPNRGLTDSITATSDFILKVRYHEDGDNDDTKTKYFRVQASYEDLEDGILRSDVEITSVELVDRDFVLP